MRTLFAATAFAFLTACGQGQTAASPTGSAISTEITAPAEETGVIAVLSYADWCGSCKALDPKISAVLDANTFDGVEIFSLDYTARDDAAFYAAAETLGVAETLRGEFGDKIKTGKMYLIDAAAGTIISRIDKTMDEAAIAAAIEASVAPI
ncbi:MAG: thioredoxin family protein [Pseudomonadota bacterium]